jgi:hypothetical protein
VVGVSHARVAARTRWLVPVACATAGAALCSTMVWRTSSALFSGTTSNSSNSWATGGVSLSDDSSSTALFNSGTDGLLSGGQTLTKCIKVTYTGSVTSGVSVKLYSTASGALAPYLNLTVDQGTGGGFGSCTGFTVGTAGIYSGTVSGMATADTNFATGAGSWAPGSNGATQTYRFTVTVSSAAAAQSTTAAGSFTWEAQA